MISTHFKRTEFACGCGCGFDTVDTELLSALERVREHFGKPVMVTSGCRCENHNESVGGSMRSQHLFGRAADIVVKDTHPVEVHTFIEQQFPDKYGLGLYGGWVHLDTRSGNRARWDKR